MKRFPFLPLVATACVILAGCQTLSSQGDGAADTEVIDGAHHFSRPVRSWKALKQDNVVIQKHDFSCGAACEATILQYFWGDNVSEDKVVRAILARLTDAELKDRIENGLTMTDLRRAAVDLGYDASIGRVKLEKLMEAKAPVIVRIKRNGHEHFVVVRGFAEDRVFLADPIRGNVRESIDVFAGEWTDGTVLVVAKRNTDPPTNHPLQVTEPSPVTPEYQSARRATQLDNFYPGGHR